MKLLVSPGVRNRDISLSSGTIQLNPGTNKMKLLSHIVGISCYRTFIRYRVVFKKSQSENMPSITTRS